MNLFIFPLILSSLLLVSAFFAYGMGYRLTRKYLKLALDEAEAENYEASRRYILNAVRLFPKYKRHPELVSFYDAVIEKRAAIEARRMREAMDRWTETKLERLFQSDGFAVLAVILSVAIVIARFANLR